MALDFQWSLFESHLINSNRELYEDKLFADVTLVSEDMKKFKAHKTVLGTASTILKDLFLAKPDQKITILLKGIFEQELTQVLKFLYLGEAVIDVDRIEEFEMAAKYLKIEVLEDMTYDTKKKQRQNTQQTPSLTNDENTLYVGFNSNENTIYIDPSLNQNIFANLETNDGILDHGGLDIENIVRTKQSIPSSKEYEDNTCKLCGKAFTRAWNLKAHIQSVHEGVKKKYVGKFVGRHEETLHTSGIPSKNVINSASIASMLFPVKREY